MMFQKRTNDDEERYGANEEEESTIRQENGFEKQKNSREHWMNLVQIKGIYWLTLTAIALSIAWIWQKRENSAVEQIIVFFTDSSDTLRIKAHIKIMGQRRAKVSTNIIKTRT